MNRHRAAATVAEAHALAAATVKSGSIDRKARRSVDDLLNRISHKEDVSAAQPEQPPQPPPPPPAQLQAPLAELEKVTFQVPHGSRVKTSYA